MYLIKVHELRQFIISIVASTTYFHIGMSVSSISPMLSKLRDPNQTPLVEPLTDTDASWIASACFLSGLIMIWFSGYLSNFMGRKTCIIVLFVPRLMMCFIYLFATRTWMFILARVLDGINDTVIPHVTSYASEIASTKIRGAVCVISQIMASLGVMLMLTTGPYISYMNLQILNTCLVFFTFFLLLFIPESPYYLHTIGKKEECIKTLTYLRGSTELAEEEHKSFSSITEASFKMKELLNDKVALKAMGIVVVLGISSQAVGLNIIIPNLQSIYEASKTNVSPELSSLISGCIALTAAVCAVILTDRFGRKPLLFVALMGYSIGMLCLGLFFKLTAEYGVAVTGALNYLPLVSVLLIMFCNTIGLGCLSFTVMAELFEGPLRTIGVAIGDFLALAVVFLGTKYYYILLEHIGAAATYWIFTGFSVFALIFIMLCVPETKGKPFSQIQRELGRKETVSEFM